MYIYILNIYIYIGYWGLYQETGGFFWESPSFGLLSYYIGVHLFMEITTCLMLLLVAESPRTPCNEVINPLTLILNPPTPPKY